MPRPPAHTTLDAAVRAAMEPVVKRASAAIARAVAEMAAAKLESELEAEVARKGGRGRRRRSVNGASSRPRGEITRWAADRRARRVPNFVIDMTGLKTKKQIVAKFGDGVVFEKGKPAPKSKG